MPPPQEPEDFYPALAVSTPRRKARRMAETPFPRTPPSSTPTLGSSSSESPFKSPFSPYKSIPTEPTCTHAIPSTIPVEIRVLYKTACPQCSVAFHIARIKHVQHALSLRGGVFASKTAGVTRLGKEKDGVPFTHTDLAKSLWRKAKVALMNEVERLRGAVFCQTKGAEREGADKLLEEWGMLEEAIALYEKEEGGLNIVPGIELVPDLKEVTGNEQKKRGAEKGEELAEENNLDADDEEDGGEKEKELVDDEEAKKIANRVMMELVVSLSITIQEVEEEIAEEEEKTNDSVSPSPSTVPQKRQRVPSAKIPGTVNENKKAKVQGKTTKTDVAAVDGAMEVAAIADSKTPPPKPKDKKFRWSDARTPPAPKPKPSWWPNSTPRPRPETSCSTTAEGTSLPRPKSGLEKILAAFGNDTPSDSVDTTSTSEILPQTPKPKGTVPPTTPERLSPATPKSILQRRPKADFISASPRNVGFHEVAIIWPGQPSFPSNPDSASSLENLSVGPIMKPHNAHATAETKRRTGNYWRAGSVYKPNTWASPEGESKENTSWYKVDWNHVEKMLDENGLLVVQPGSEAYDAKVARAMSKADLERKAKSTEAALKKAVVMSGQSVPVLEEIISQDYDKLYVDVAQGLRKALDDHKARETQTKAEKRESSDRKKKEAQSAAERAWAERTRREVQEKVAEQQQDQQQPGSQYAYPDHAIRLESSASEAKRQFDLEAEVYAAKMKAKDDVKEKKKTSTKAHGKAKGAPTSQTKDESQDLEARLRVIASVWVLTNALRGVGNCFSLRWLGELALLWLEYRGESAT